MELATVIVETKFEAFLRTLSEPGLLSDMGDGVLFLVRVILGVVMVYYGWPKIKNLKSNAADFVSMGFRPGWLWGTLIAFVEFFGGLLIIIGSYFNYVLILLGIQMLLGTIWKITKTKKPFTDWSYDLLILAVVLLLLLTGPGTYPI